MANTSCFINLQVLKVIGLIKVAFYGLRHGIHHHFSPPFRGNVFGTSSKHLMQANP